MQRRVDVDVRRTARELVDARGGAARQRVASHVERRQLLAREVGDRLVQRLQLQAIQISHPERLEREVVVHPLVGDRRDQPLIIGVGRDDAGIRRTARDRHGERRQPAVALCISFDRLDLGDRQLRAQVALPDQLDRVAGRERKRARWLVELNVDGRPQPAHGREKRQRRLQPNVLEQRRQPPLDDRLDLVLDLVALVCRPGAGELGAQDEVAADALVLVRCREAAPKEPPGQVEPLAGDVAHLPGDDVELVVVRQVDRARQRPRGEERGEHCA